MYRLGLKIKYLKQFYFFPTLLNDVKFETKSAKNHTKLWAFKMFLKLI